jgi:hypothetical protein
MKLGMSKAEAKERVYEGSYTWDDMRRLLQITRPVLVGAPGERASRVNRGCSRAMAFNLYWKAIKEMSGRVRDSRGARELIAVNILRDFGDAKRTRKPRPPIDVAHEPLIDIANGGAK